MIILFDNFHSRMKGDIFYDEKLKKWMDDDEKCMLQTNQTNMEI